MEKVILVAVGGAIGAVMRYLVGIGALKLFGNIFPWGTFLINVSGSFLIGIIWGLSEKLVISDYHRVLLSVGILGAFTTFSTFSIESVKLFQTGQIKFAILYILSSCVIGILLTWMGYSLLNNFSE